MSTAKADHLAEQTRREHANAVRHDADAAASRRRGRLRLAAWVAGFAVLAGVVTLMMLNSRNNSSSASRVAPDFTLTNTAGTQVRLADFRGQNVLLFFSEGAGCQSCLVQMAQLEKATQFAKAKVVVLPIVMNTREQITSDMKANGVTSPVLLDDGTVSRAYGTIGKGMHAGLPGHSFVLIDKKGVQRWYGEYPGMWLAPADLFTEVQKHLGS